MKKYSAVVVLLLVTILSGSAQAQTGLGGIEGFVYDNEGKVIPDADLAITSTAMMGQATTKASKYGYYRFINLQPGSYTLKVSKGNYQAQEITNISVRGGKTSSFNVTLEVGEFTETLVIVHEAPIIDLKTTKRNVNVSGEFFNRLPISPNNEWNNIYSIIPGVNKPFDDQGAGGEHKAIVIHKADTRQNMWNIDGSNVAGTSWKTPTVMISPDVIEDFSVVTSGFDASTRPGQGGYVNVITKSGGNEFRGSMSLLYQPFDWNYTNEPDGVADESELYQPDFTISGPLMRDKAWFIANYRYSYSNSKIPKSPEAIEQLAAIELEPYGEQNETRFQRLFGKLTYQLSDNHQVQGTYVYDEGENRHNSSLTNSGPNSGANNRIGGPFLSASLTSAWSDTFSSILQVSYRDSTDDHWPDSGTEPAIFRYPSTTIQNGLISGMGNSGVYNNSPYYPAGYGYQDRLEIKADGDLFVEDLFGTHEVKVGALYQPFANHYQTSTEIEVISEALDANGRWTPFYSVSYFDPENPNQPWEGAESDTETEYWSVFLNDTWTVNDRLSLSFGLRYDQQSDNDIIDVGSLSPHVGANYALTQDGRNSLRASYVRRYSSLTFPLNAIASDSGSASRLRRYDLDMDGIWDVEIIDPGSPGREKGSGNFLYSNGPAAVDDDLTMPYFDEFLVGYTTVLPLNVKFDFAYIFRRYKNDIYYYNSNILFENNQFVGYKDPDYAKITTVTNDIWSYTDHQSYEFMLTREFKDNWQLMASYTHYSHVTKGEWGPDNPDRYVNPADYFESYYDGQNVTDFFKISAATILPFDINLSGFFQWSVGSYYKTLYTYAGWADPSIPASVLINGQQISNPMYQARKFLTPRTEEPELKSDDIWSLNASIGKTFLIKDYSLLVQLNVYNLTNEGGYRSINAFDLVFPDGSWLIDPTPWMIQPPRQIQLMMKVSF